MRKLNRNRFYFFQWFSHKFYFHNKKFFLESRWRMENNSFSDRPLMIYFRKEIPLHKTKSAWRRWKIHPRVIFGAKNSPWKRLWARVSMLSRLLQTFTRAAVAKEASWKQQKLFFSVEHSRCTTFVISIKLKWFKPRWIGSRYCRCLMKTWVTRGRRKFISNSLKTRSLTGRLRRNFSRNFSQLFFV